MKLKVEKAKILGKISKKKIKVPHLSDYKYARKITLERLASGERNKTFSRLWKSGKFRSYYFKTKKQVEKDYQELKTLAKKSYPQSISRKQLKARLEKATSEETLRKYIKEYYRRAYRGNARKQELRRYLTKSQDVANKAYLLGEKENILRNFTNPTNMKIDLDVDKDWERLEPLNQGSQYGYWDDSAHAIVYPETIEDQINEIQNTISDLEQRIEDLIAQGDQEQADELSGELEQAKDLLSKWDNLPT